MTVLTTRLSPALKFLVSAFLCLPPTAALVATAAASEGALPNPIVTEQVLPGIIFGRSGPVELETDVVLANPSDAEVFVSFELFSSTGDPAVLDFEQNSGFFPVSAAVSVAPRSAFVLAFNSIDNRLENPALFAGWGTIRANGAVGVTLTLRVWDRRSLREVSVLNILGVPRRLREALFPVLTATTEQQSAIVVTTPGTTGGAALRAQLLDQRRFFDPPEAAALVAEKDVTVPPNGQLLMTATELFPGLEGDFVRIVSEDPEGFATTTMVFRFETDSGELFLLRFPVFDRIRNQAYRFVEIGPWDFDAGFEEPVMVGSVRLTPTEFGVFLETPAAGPDFFPFAKPLIFADQELGIAVAGDDRAKIIVFDDGFFIEETLPGQEVNFATLEDGRIEVEGIFGVDVGLVARAHKLILIDPQTRMIVDRFTGEIGQPPPWR